MNDNEKKSGGWKAILGGIVLIIVLFVGIKLVFWGLGEAIPQTHLNGAPDASASRSAPGAAQRAEDAPSFCIHCGKALPESFEWGQFCPYCGEKVE